MPPLTSVKDLPHLDVLYITITLEITTDYSVCSIGTGVSMKVARQAIESLVIMANSSGNDIY